MSDAFNHNASGLLRSLIKRLAEPQGAAQIEADLREAAKLTASAKSYVVEAVLAEVVDNFKALAEPATLLVLKNRLARPHSHLAGRWGQELLEASQNTSRIVAWLSEEKKGDLPACVQTYAQKIAAMSEACFASPGNHLQATIAAAEKTLPGQSQNPFKKGQQPASSAS